MRIFRVLMGTGVVGIAAACSYVYAMQGGTPSTIVDQAIARPLGAAPAQPVAAPAVAKFLDRVPMEPDEAPSEESAVAPVVTAEAPAVVTVPETPPAVIAQVAPPASDITNSITKPRPTAEAAPRPAVTRIAAARAPAVPARCLTVEEMQAYDGDGDFSRNQAALNSPDLCMSVERFDEGGLHWTLQIIRKKPDGHGPFWYVPHDDENAAFDTAVDSIRRYGGTIVAVESNGQRLMQGQDPNRNFDAGGDGKCPQQLARSPIFTKRVLAYWEWQQDQPIIALHSNRPTGNITITRKVPFSTNFRAPNQIGGVNPDHTLVFVASRDAPDADPNLKSFVDALNAQGVNVIYETVSNHKRSDCSLSNYASLKDIRNYLNVEVVTGDSAIQKKIVAVLMKQLESNPIGPRSAVASPGSTPPAADIEGKPKKKRASKKAPTDGVARTRPPTEQ